MSKILFFLHNRYIMIEKKIVNIPSNLWAYKVRLECLTFLTSFFFLKNKQYFCCWSDLDNYRV